jgi:hypothetical protein
MAGAVSNKVTKEKVYKKRLSSFLPNQQNNDPAKMKNKKLGKNKGEAKLFQTPNYAGHPAKPTGI